LFGKFSRTRRHRSAPNDSAEFVSPVVSPGCIKMGRFLMTWDNERSSASREEKVVYVVETTGDEI